MRFDINLPGPFIQDGSVISSYQSSQSWNFTTIESPADWNHPVSGNRTFGYTNNGDGTATFFTRGVDRLSNNWYETAQNLGGFPYAKADDLWKSFQQGIKDYINQHGGNATINNPVHWRPDWTDVKGVLDRTKSIATLGCN